MSMSTPPYKAAPFVAAPAANMLFSVNSSQMIVAQNLSRTAISISNPTSGLTAANLFISFTNPAVANKGVCIGPGSEWTLYRCPTDAIYGIVPGITGSATMCVQEFTAS